jgi:CO/xanthine dehydrogenase Mo-binding subunit
MAHQGQERAPDFAVVGRPVRRVDAEAKVRGSAVYGVDVRLPGMLEGRFLRAGIPHARIASIDTSRALKVPGVRAVVTGLDWPRRHGPLVKDQPALAIDRVRYAGEAVAAVAAEDEDAAAEALDQIVVDYDPLPVVTNLDEALAPGAPRLHEHYDDYERATVPGIRLRGEPGTNIPYHFKLRKGDAGQAFDAADVVVEREFSTQAIQYCHLEPHVAVAQFDAAGALTVWESTMGPHTLRSMLAEFLDLPLSMVRVITPLVGGAYGAKMYLRAINPVAVLLARKTAGRPVRVVFDREDEFFTSPVRVPARILMRTAATRDGLITARQAVIHWEQGAYVDLTPIKVRNSGYVSLGPYRIPNACVDGYLVYTNRQPGGAFRGLGVPQVSWAGESQIDDLARRLRMDPVELRLRNVLADGDRSVTGELLRDVGARACLDASVAAARRWPRLAAGEGRKVGRGYAVVMKSTLTPTVTFGTVRMNLDGSVDVMTAAVEHGQGAHTVLAQMVAEELSVSLARVRIGPVDTLVAPFDRSSTSSRTTFSMGNAIRAAATDVRAQLLSMAADVLEAEPDDLELSDGAVRVKGDPDSRVAYADVLSAYYKGPATIIGEGRYGTHKTYDPMDPDTAASARPSAFWAYGAAAAEVEFDEGTGEIAVRRLAVAVDAGRAINPQSCAQQIAGSAVMGIGMALMEQLQFEDGLPANPTLLDYKVLTTLDVPALEPLIVETADREGPYGARGVGEVGLAPVPAAIGNAVLDATGTQLVSLPMRAETNRAAVRRASRP